MGHHYRLIYFNLRGRAELSRLILNYAQVPFEDYRFEESQWPQIKPKMPFGQVPVLEVNGKMLAQSSTIARYLAREHDLAGKDRWEQALADMYVDCIGDIDGWLRPILNELDISKHNKVDKLNTDMVQPYMAKIEQNLVQNGTGFLVGKSLTWADLAYYDQFAPMAEKYGEDVIFPNAPHLKTLVGYVGNLLPIKSYIQSRPKTDR